MKASHGLVTGSFTAPADAIFRDFDQDARIGKFGAKPVGGLAVAGGAGRLHLGNLVFDVCVRELSRLNRLWQLVARVLVAAFGRGPRKDAFILGPSSSSSTAKISIVGSTAGNIGPPGQQNRWPSEPMGLGKLPATQTNAIEQPCPRNYWFSAEKLKSRGFASAFS